MSNIDLDMDWTPPEKKRYRKWPFPMMEVGHSFFESGQSGLNASKSCHIWGKRHSKTFTTREVEENGVKGYRICRIG